MLAPSPLGLWEYWNPLTQTASSWFLGVRAQPSLLFAPSPEPTPTREGGGRRGGGGGAIVGSGGGGSGLGLPFFPEPPHPQGAGARQARVCAQSFSPLTLAPRPLSP